MVRGLNHRPQSWKENVTTVAPQTCRQGTGLLAPVSHIGDRICLECLLTSVILLNGIIGSQEAKRTLKNIYIFKTLYFVSFMKLIFLIVCKLNNFLY